MHFWRQYNNTWAKLLRFLPASSHATCDDCLELKELAKMFRQEPWHIVNSGWFCLLVSVALGTVVSNQSVRQSVCSQMKTEDLQMTYNVVKEYKEHIDSVKKDRHPEEWLEVGQPHTELFSAALKPWKLEHGLGSCPTPLKAQCPVQHPGSPICVHMETWAQSFFWSSFINALRKESWANCILDGLFFIKLKNFLQ